jgi:predicted enzyme related to lactoylglutathione lyase
MNERDSYPAGVPCWVDTTQPDPDAAAAFYGGLLGWDLVDRTPPGMPGRYLVGQMRGLDVAAISSPAEGAPSSPAWTTYVAVDSVDEAAARAAAAGGRVLLEPTDVGEAGRVALLADPEGAIFGVWQAGATIGAQLVNEPGAWNFSGVHARDLEGALAFYGAVFGWEAMPMNEADGTLMLLMPGYGDFLEAREPGLRQRVAELGGPERFEDVVAWLGPLDRDEPAHWSITFATDDADAAARRAAELGGTVLAEPFDAPWVRSTVVRDPQGAVVTLSKFVPPSD